jgi:rhamnosyltransferase
MVYHSHNYPLRSYFKRYYDDFKAVYRVYGTVLCPDLRSYVHHILGDTKHQGGYILRQQDLSFAEKIYWCYYAFRRNVIRNQAAKKAVDYFRCTKQEQQAMDQSFSQQYEQRG